MISFSLREGWLLCCKHEIIGFCWVPGIGSIWAATRLEPSLHTYSLIWARVQGNPMIPFLVWVQLRSSSRNNHFQTLVEHCCCLTMCAPTSRSSVPITPLGSTGERTNQLPLEYLACCCVLLPLCCFCCYWGPTWSPSCRREELVPGVGLSEKEEVI